MTRSKDFGGIYDDSLVHKITQRIEEATGRRWDDIRDEANSEDPNWMVDTMRRIEPINTRMMRDLGKARDADPKNGIFVVMGVLSCVVGRMSRWFGRAKTIECLEEMIHTVRTDTHAKP
jgi:hypothetical protein